MKPIIKTPDFKEIQNIDWDVERRNQLGLPSSHVYMTITKTGRVPSVTVIVNSRRINALVDSSSNVTIVTKGFLQQNDYKIWFR